MTHILNVLILPELKLWGFFVFIRSCFEAFTENMAGETLLLELRRLYHCAAYNCAIAAISCSFSEPKFYHGFLFSEKPEKVQADFLTFSFCHHHAQSTNFKILLSKIVPFFLPESVHPGKYH